MFTASFTTSRRRSLILLVTLFAFASFTDFSSANHSWGSYHWARTSNPFTLKLVDNVTSTWDARLSTASSDWTAASVLNTSIVAGTTSSFARYLCSPTSGRVKVCNYTYGSTGWLGIAQIWVTGGVHITQGTVKVNDTYHNSAPYNTTAYRQFVMCQEIGHTFGLTHTDEVFDNANQGTCMDYTNDPDGGAGGASSTDPSNEHPNAHDFAQLSTIYAHTDSSTTVGQSLPSALADLDLSDPSQWGRLIRGSRESGKSIHVREFAGDVKVFTFVTWAK